MQVAVHHSVLALWLNDQVNNTLIEDRIVGEKPAPSLNIHYPTTVARIPGSYTTTRISHISRTPNSGCHIMYIVNITYALPLMLNFIKIYQYK